MEITKELIKERFKTLNKTIFNGKLPLPHKFAVKQFNLVAGQIQINNNGKNSIVTILISNCFDYNDTTLNEVIIHEMIHYYLFIKGDKNAFKHKTSFIDICKKIKNEFGFEIHTNAKHIPLYDKYKPKKSNIESVLYWILKPIISIYNIFL